MESIKKVPTKLYWFLAAILELVMVFFVSIFKLKKPSDSLTREDITEMRRGNNPGGHSGNDWRYRGSRGKGGFI